MERAALWTSSLAGPGVAVARVQQQGLRVPSEDGGVPFQWLTWLDLGLRSRGVRGRPEAAWLGRGRARVSPDRKASGAGVSTTPGLSGLISSTFSSWFCLNKACSRRVHASATWPPPGSGPGTPQAAPLRRHRREPTGPFGGMCVALHLGPSPGSRLQRWST